MNVYVLVIKHSHGSNVSVFSTEELAYDALDAYVQEWWNTETLQAPMPADPAERVDAYFDSADESYDVTAHTVDSGVTAEVAA